MVFGDVDQRRQQQFERGAIVRRFEITVERVKEPKRRVRGVIFPFGRFVREHVRNQTVADVMRERAQNVTGFEPAPGRQGSSLPG